MNQLSSIKDNTAPSQVLAALALIQMNVTPVIALHIPFGGDNHRDIGLQTETAQTVSGVATIAGMMAQLASAGLADKVTFISLDVFGRTLGPANVDGRQHNPNHQVSITIGNSFRGGVIGGVGPVGNDYGALSIDSKTGKAAPGGDITPATSLASFGRTMLAGVGVDPAVVSYEIGEGQVIASALA